MADALQPLRVHEGGRFLITADDQPFFWLGDTAWNLCAKLDRDEALKYLWDRKNKLFNVVQAHVLSNNLERANPYGDLAFIGGDSDRPVENYWQHVDYIVATAAELGLYMALLPAWAGAHVENKRKATRGVLELTPDKARRYGRFLARRYAMQSHIVWVLGGDVRPEKHEVYDALARGLRDGGPDALMTYHPPGGSYRPPATSSGEFYHDRPWLDFNMIQSGHRMGNRNYERISEDYARRPHKPTLDSEPCYEKHPVLHKFDNGQFEAWHLRRRAYWSVLAGACGYTYGGNGIWQMDKPGAVLKYSHHNYYWYDALHFEGAQQMRHVRRLFESRPCIAPERVPSQSVLLSPAGDGDDRTQAARAADGSYCIAYATSGQELQIDLTQLRGGKLNAWWYNPRDGKTYEGSNLPVEEPFARLPRSGAQTFSPPGDQAAGSDWVLVLDDDACGYGPPGA